MPPRATPPILEPTPEGWLQLDGYLTDTLVGNDEALTSAIADQDSAGLPSIEVAPLNGKFLHLLARMSGARRVLEIGTLGAYSTIWLARGIPSEGRVVTVEAEPRNAAIARANLDRAGIGEKVEIVIGRASDVLPTLEAPIRSGEEGAFDLVFIDADKESTTIYLEWAARLGRPGTVVIVDNIGRGGEVAHAETTNQQALGVRRGLEMMAADPRFDATALQTLDRKGWDGVALALIV